MITTRIAAGLAACALAVGILAGSAETIVLHDATAAQTVDWTTHMSEAGSMMSTMAGGGGMMNGSGGMMNGQNGMITGPAASSMPSGQHDLHHPTASPDGSK